MDTDNQAPEDCRWCEESVQRCRKLLVQFGAGITTFEEFAYNDAFSLLEVCCESCLRAYFNSLPDSAAVQFNDYLQSLMVSEGPTAFVWPSIMPTTQAEMRLKLPRMEPKIKQLCCVASERALGAHRSKYQCD